jgi:RimJ/RimL family protein N-acetyltransferase
MLSGMRVRLRALEPGDAAVVWRWHQDREFSVLDGTRYPTTLARTEDWLRSLGDPAYWGAYLGIEQPDGTLIGHASLTRTAPEDRSAEFGIAIARAFWDQGYGGDATRTLLRFAFDQMNLHRVWLQVVEHNARARRVFASCGFREEGHLREARFTDGRWWDLIVMGILARELADQPALSSADHTQRQPSRPPA